jgi:dephospho-CoA kinase
MLRVGITGGIGSGKSTVARMFELLDVPVYYADDEAKKLMNYNPDIQKEVISIFGPSAYVNNELDRSYVGKVAFAAPEKLKALNAVVHPAVIAHGQAWMAKQHAPYTLKEAALIFESDSYKQLDLVIGVWCPWELRLARVMQRDITTRENVLARMEKQMDEEEKMKRCDFVILNDEQHALIPQVLDLHWQLLERT